MIRTTKQTLIILVLALIGFGQAAAQGDDLGIMPFMGIEPSARQNGLAGAGSTLTDNPLAIYSNAAANLLDDNKWGVATFAGPWNKDFDSSPVLYGVGGFYKLKERNSFLAGYRYMPGVRMDIIDDQGFPSGTARSKDFSIDVGYARKMTKDLSLSLTVHYAVSDQGFGDKSLSAFTFDVGTAYGKTLSRPMGGFWSVGLRLADLGAKVRAADGIKYSVSSRAIAGGSLTIPLSVNHTLACAADLTYRFTPTGLFEAGLGAEYTFLRHGIIRGGYHIGSQDKGTGNYTTLGCGLILRPIRFDASWRMASDRSNPHHNTLVFSVGVLI